MPPSTKLMTKIAIAAHELLLDHDWVAEAAGGVFKLQNSKAAIPIVDAEDCDPFKTEFCVNVPGERVSLHAIILNNSVVPGDDCLGNSGIG